MQLQWKTFKKKMLLPGLSLAGSVFSAQAYALKPLILDPAYYPPESLTIRQNHGLRDNLKARGSEVRRVLPCGSPDALKFLNSGATNGTDPCFP